LEVPKIHLQFLLRDAILIADMDGKLVLVTQEESWKVKRIRNNPTVALAPCNSRGSDVGTYVPGQAQVVSDPAEIIRLDAIMTAKYGWQTWPFRMMAKVSGKVRVGIVITLKG
jgi:PPOX class probable F420-dependent enzyme